MTKISEEYDLKAEIRNIGMTQREFAKHIDKSVHTITRWIKQDLKLPKLVIYILNHIKNQNFWRIFQFTLNSKILKIHIFMLK